MERILSPKCHICQETNFRALYCDEVYKARAPKSQKTILDIIRHISRVLKVTFNVPARARVCTVCYKELVRYDCYVVELLEVQKRLSDKINARVKGIKLQKPTAFPAGNRSTNFAGNDGDDKNFNNNNGDDDSEDDNKEDMEAIEDDDDYDDDNSLLAEQDVTSSVSGHQEQENLNDNYPCPVCNLKLKNQRALDYHLDKDHKNRVTCNVCGVQVRNDEYLALHMNLHNGKTENDCSFCDKSFARRVNVIRHMQVHFNKKKHQCERCGMFFTQTTIFYNHRLQHEAEDNPLICSICSQTFKTIRTYKRHMVTHQEDRPRYNCEFCGGDDSQEQTTTQSHKKVKVSTEEEQQDHKLIIRKSFQMFETIILLKVVINLVVTPLTVSTNFTITIGVDSVNNQ
ncbi:hypothetical protein DOY81_005914 [Sarcophaga bullata]|nr:hypothetical protein DOY81_005914 [Sarcophaga bullata]